MIVKIKMNPNLITIKKKSFLLNLRLIINFVVVVILKLAIYFDS